MFFFLPSTSYVKLAVTVQSITATICSQGLLGIAVLTVSAVSLNDPQLYAEAEGKIKH